MIVTVLKKSVGAALVAAALISLGGCAAKNGGETVMTQLDTGWLVERHFEEPMDLKKLKKAALEAAEAEGWMTTPLGERRIVAEKYFSETSNIAAVIELYNDGYAVEYSSGQGIGSKAKSLIRSLADAIEEAVEKAPGNE